MQRVKPALVKPAPNSAPLHLVPSPNVPHAEYRTSLPAEWSWTEDSARHHVATPPATFTPTGYEPGYAYPVLVWLHGQESDERSLPRVMQHVSLRNFVAVAPPAQDRRWLQTPLSIDAAEDALFEAIETAGQKFHINPSRVFLAGVGAGGTMAMRLALRQPDAFAGVATLDGPLPSGDRLLCRVNEARELPLLLSSSRQSPSYPETQLCRDLSLLHSAGCRVSVRQYPGDDDLTTAMLADLNSWAMEIVCG